MNTWIRNIIAGCLVLGLCAFGLGQATGTPGQAFASPETTQAQEAPSASAAPAKPSAKQLKAFKKASADFSLELFQKCVAAKGKNANVTIAPLSVMNALAVTANGAGGKTATQMREVLGDGASMTRINKNLAWYNSKLVNAKKAKVRNANGIWYHDDGTLKMKPAFLKAAKTYYKAQVSPADFSSPATVDDINSWVSDNTNGMIKKIVNSLDADDRIAIVNALYFDADWKVPFEKETVRTKTFTAANGKKRKVKMMYATEHTYVEGDGVTGFIKPYVKGYSYVALLPKKGTSLKKFVASLDGDAFRKLVGGASDATVKIALPKYSVSYTNDGMEKQLKAMGIKQAFSSKANFTKMAKSAAGDLSIGSVVHKTKVELDEKGTKAAAATGVFLKANSMLDPDVKTVTLNRPFVYAIIDNTTKLPVFIGTINNIGK